MKIYLAGSMSGGREFEAGLKLIGEMLKMNEHEILSDWVLNPTGDFSDRSPEKLNYILYRDMIAIENCDAAVVEISQPSFGVGIELAELARRGKPILCLRHESVKDRMLSALVEADSRFQVEYYNDGSLGPIIEEFLGKVVAEKEGGRVVLERQR